LPFISHHAFVMLTVRSGIIQCTMNSSYHEFADCLGAMMCGIAGWVSYERDLTEDRAGIEAMTATMALRGPDDSGVWISPHAALGHRRLAVIDIEGGVQPMTAATPDGPVALTYSGEVYNFGGLRSQLRQRGHVFSTASDTEVVLRGYLEWGPGVADHLNGMYAFAVWDSRDQTLVLIRDRMGIKPLYYYPTSDGVLFGSEPKAILASPLARPVVDAGGLREMFSGFLRTPGQAVWAGMHEVKPGHTVTVNRGGLREQPYWTLRALPHTDDLDTTISTIRHLLEDIITSQLVADVPRCILLSGGLDSSSLTGLAAHLLARQGEKVRTYSVDFTGQAKHFQPQIQLARPTRDLPFVHDVVAHVGTDHQDVVLNHQAVSSPQARRACVAARDLPVGLGDRDTSLYLLLQAIRAQSPLALSGDASDAIFASYPTVHDRQLAHAGSPTPGLLDFPFIDIGLLSHGFLEQIGREDYLRARYAEAVQEAPVLDSDDDQERRMRLYCYLDLMRMVPQLLADRRDRIGMAAGVEIRVPYYDHRLVEYVFNVPFGMKTFDGREKSLLRAAAKDVLPSSVYGREKSGYPSPHDPQYVSLLQNQVREVLSSNHTALDFYDRHLVRDAIQEDPQTVSNTQRCGMERLLDVAIWFDLWQPTVKVG
jgi:asparagine synthase (glutamine-hydrolysing)